MRLVLAGVWVWWVLLSGVVAQEPSAGFEIVGTPRQYILPKGLKEISGLALASDNSVYAHNDEHGIVYEIDLFDGEVKKAFALGKPTIRADFEGIAAENGRIYLVTSSGKLFEALIVEHRKRVRFNMFDTGVGAFCEVEGLARSGQPGEFFILCKVAKLDALRRRLVIYRWSLAERTPVLEPWLNIPYAELLSEKAAEKFYPSALDWDSDRQALAILSAYSQQLIVVNEKAELLYEETWSKDDHAQAEGVLLMPSGELVVADEGQRNEPGKISVYRLNR